MIKGLCILGSTGSIGQNCLRVVRGAADQFRVVSLCAGKNLDLLAEQAREFAPRFVVVGDQQWVEPLRERLRALGVSAVTEVASGVASQTEAATHPEVHTVVSASHGTTGLVATYKAVEAGKRIALANKEVMVTAGELITRTAHERGSEILPVDSEHCAIHQCLRAGGNSEVRRLILTASGGPFRKTPKKDFDRITPEDAMQHPVWKMGGRVTIDSSTMMNKGLEIIEARWLFGFPSERIDVLIHPESIVHSMVEFIDGSVMAQMSVPDMRLPIQYALTYPVRLAIDSGLKGLDLTNLRRLHFAAPDTRRFPCLELAREALHRGGSMPCVMNAADEIAVEAFLDRRLRFSSIPRLIEKVMKQTACDSSLGSLDEVLECDHEARIRATELVESIGKG